MSIPNFGSSSRSKSPGKGASLTGRLIGIGAGVAVVFFFIVPIFVGMYTDFAWFRSVDYQGVFVNVLLVRVAMFVVFGLVAAVLTWLAIFVAYRARPDEFQQMGSSSPLQELRPLIKKNLRPFLVGIPFAVGAVAGIIAQSNWRTVLLFLNGSEFGQTDAQFNKDLGFYAFNLPMLTLIVTSLSFILVVAFLLNLITHYFLGSITTGNARVGEKAHVSDVALRQLAVIAGAWMLVKALDYWFARYELLNSSNATFTGAGYTDINAVLPAKIALLVISIFVAAMFFGTIVLKDLRIPALAVALMVGSVVTLSVGWPAVLEQFSVNPNRAEKERDYIARNIEATRFAYNLGDDHVTYERNWGADAKPHDDKVDNNTLNNIRLLDPQVLSPTFTQQQQLKNFYGFPDKLAIDRYDVDGEMRDFVVAARELDPNALDGNQQDWINRHTVYTHGNGLIAAPANKVDEVARDVGSARGGYPVYTVADLQSLESKNQGGELKLDLKQPRIYFGPLIASNDAPNADYAIVGNQSASTPQEYDTDANNYTYTGNGGVDVSNYFNRLMFSAHFQSMNMLLTDRIGEGSRILHERDPRERVHKVAPWLTTDSTTYPVVLDGRIKWVVDGYTTLDNLPYSERTSLTDTTADALNPEGVNQNQIVTNDVSYIRNSVKAVVDSYDGSVDLYQFDEKDPVLKAWMGAFPDVVKPKAEISEDLNNHLRYPSDIFKVQRELIAKYHVSDPGIFFQNDSFWSVPTDPTAEERRQNLPQPPYYVVAADPETKKSSFQLITPFRGLSRQFLAAHMSVSSDPETYGQIHIRALPTSTQTQGPAQAQDTMMSSDEIARERTLLKGSNELINGNLLTLPIGDGKILYVEPVYSKRAGQDSAFPKLLRVLVSYNNQVGYAPTIAEALEQVGLDASAVQDLKEVDGSVVSGSSQSDSEKSEEKKNESGQQSEAQKNNSQGSGSASQASKKVRDAMDKVNRTRESGSFEEFGKALDELDKAVSELQSGQ
ncbi:UPF0182 family protein [Corynebacterium sp. 320]|nr:UPF0182 family protein [Corynebacterium sp. 320]KAB1552759.1 UPF0182 family protein [Corynebacterium sp. 321]KAB1554023.1 UPF0182 family protein [Corynebacterium sp. 319]KAB3528277.1 UPF0182 family protein [Corynebacterium sp. 250]KAB3540234.1 UPF0182 family protein [Corynebacterium sp. 366]